MPAQISFVLMLLVCAAALWKGRILHRLVAVLFAAAWIASGLLQDRDNVLSPQWAIFAVDIVLALIVSVLAIRNRPWWIAAFAALTWLQVMTHVTMWVDNRVWVWAYVTGMAIWGRAELLLLGYATWRSWSEARRPRAAAERQHSGATEAA